MSEAVVLAAGFGTRFRPLTLSIPKPALPFLNRPILHWTFEALELAGVDRAFVNLHHLPAQVKETALSYRGGIEVSFSPEEKILGTAGVLWPLRERISSDVFLVANADTHFDLNAAELLKDLESHPASLATLAVLRRRPESPHTALDVDPGGTLLDFGKGEWFFAGLYAARKGLIGRLGKAGYAELVRDLLLPATAEGLVRAVPLRGSWGDLGEPKAYLERTADLLEAWERAPSTLPRCRLERHRGFPCLLHEAAELSPGAILSGPIVAGEGSLVEEGALVGRTVLLPGGTAPGGEDLQNAIIGRVARIAGLAP